MRKKIYQMMADYIYLMAKHSITQDQFAFWYGWGIYLNELCIEQDIYLD